MGSYQASVISTMIKELPDIETTYDVVTGVSVGSLNGAMLSTIPQGREDEFNDLVMGVWYDVEPRTVFKLWPSGLVDGILKETSMFDNAPLK